MNETVTDLAQQTEKIATLIAAAGRHLAEGKMVDLTALENKVRVLCRAINEAPTGEARKLKEAIGAIIRDLDGLELGLTDHLKDLRGEIEGTFRKKAISAYGPGPKEK
jgi:hypothetical protein